MNLVISSSSSVTTGTEFVASLFGQRKKLMQDMLRIV